MEPDGTVKNRHEYLADRSSDIADIESFELADLKVSVFENCALTSGVSKNHGTPAGQALPLQPSLERAVAEK
jgi:hypothetical protein